MNLILNNLILLVIDFNVVVDFALRLFYVGQKFVKKVESKVRSIEFGQANAVGLETGQKQIQNWLKHVQEIHAQQTSDTVHLDESQVEKLMAQWPTTIDQSLSTGEVHLLM